MGSNMSMSSLFEPGSGDNRAENADINNSNPSNDSNGTALPARARAGSASEHEPEPQPAGGLLQPYDEEPQQQQQQHDDMLGLGLERRSALLQALAQFWMNGGSPHADISFSDAVRLPGDAAVEQRLGSLFEVRRPSRRQGSRSRQVGPSPILLNLAEVCPETVSHRESLKRFMHVVAKSHPELLRGAEMDDFLMTFFTIFLHGKHPSGAAKVAFRFFAHVHNIMSLARTIRINDNTPRAVLEGPEDCSKSLVEDIEMVFRMVQILWPTVTRKFEKHGDKAMFAGLVKGWFRTLFGKDCAVVPRQFDGYLVLLDLMVPLPVQTVRSDDYHEGLDQKSRAVLVHVATCIFGRHLLSFEACCCRETLELLVERLQRVEVDPNLVRMVETVRAEVMATNIRAHFYPWLSISMTVGFVAGAVLTSWMPAVAPTCGVVGAYIGGHLGQLRCLRDAKQKLQHTMRQLSAKVQLDPLPRPRHADALVLADSWLIDINDPSFDWEDGLYDYDAIASGQGGAAATRWFAKRQPHGQWEDPLVLKNGLFWEPSVSLDSMLPTCCLPAVYRLGRVFAELAELVGYDAGPTEDYEMHLRRHNMFPFNAREEQSSSWFW